MPTASQLISQGYGGYQGWGDAEANADFNATKGSGKFTGQSGGQSSSGGGDYQSFLNQQNQAQQQALAPAVNTLQSQIPQIQQKYTTQINQKQADIAPLQERYKTLLDTIKNQGQNMVNKQTVVTANELGKRGIEGSSTLAGQEIVNATQPIEQSTQSLTQQTGLAQEADVKAIQDAIANLTNQQGLDVGSVNTAIANLQAGGGQTAIQQAMQLLANQQNMQAAESASQYQAQQDAIANALAQQELGLKTKATNADIANINSQIAERGKTSSGSNVASVLQSLGIGVSGLQLPTGQNLGVGTGGWQ